MPPEREEKIILQHTEEKGFLKPIWQMGKVIYDQWTIYVTDKRLLVEGLRMGFGSSLPPSKRKTYAIYDILLNRIEAVVCKPPASLGMGELQLMVKEGAELLRIPTMVPQIFETRLKQLIGQ